ncbi:hypothetical protein LX73_1769 [Fodinibius salinus]|uniref:Uncharacterized protein n=1 Tax=Fodinibius salinus TaxID=860790 RepID=A0A5D3YM80_9BACT|nr:hypothetical protein [Fodinibius salinus]TYP94046.1 hypothetical protein LX73_1769 [Fodinibius salinus]
MIRKIIWIIGGLAITVLAFFIVDRSGSIWPAVITASIVGTIFIIGFAFRWIGEINSSLNRKAIILVLAVMLLGSSVYATLIYIDSNNQHDRLTHIRTHIEKEILSTYVQKPLLKTLRDYQTSEDAKQNIDETFYARYDSLVQDRELMIAALDESDLTTAFYVYKANADTLIIAGESSILDAKSGDFQNASGAQGRFEMHGILTPKGISYERRN